MSDSAEKDTHTLALARALWTAADLTDELTIGCLWDDLPEPQRSNWLAVAKMAQTLGVSVVPLADGGTSERVTGPVGSDALAEDLSWVSGEMSRWSPTAHPDHNRWSWRGDGHSEDFRKHFREQAQALIGLGWTRVTSPGHEQVHRPATGDSECTCGQWEGPMTALPASDPRSFGAHLARVIPPEQDATD